MATNGKSSSSGISRRDFAKRSAKFAAGAAAAAASTRRASADEEFDYIVVGSGPGGGPLAVNLARAGFKVALLEAGPDGNEIAPLISIPLFNPLVSTNPLVSWDFFVRHYGNTAQQKKDTKYVAAKDGVLYPRASTIGGCGVHNVLILMYPSNSDWDRIADTMDDASWSASNMRQYFQRIEACRYVMPGAIPDQKHGFNGWQPNELEDPAIFTGDPQLTAFIRAGAAKLGNATAYNDWLQNKLDINSWDNVRNDQEGMFSAPLTRMRGFRSGLRERILSTAAQFPNNLIIKTNTLVSRVLFEGRQAVGVEYMEGGFLYGASPLAKGGPDPQRQQLRCNREVIIAGGTFNSPQLLKLSGVGPRDELKEFGIKTIVDLPGVGENMQDRYEMGVITELKNNLNITQNCTFLQPNPGADPCFAQLMNGGGVYSTNATAIFGIRKSSPQQTDRDLLIIFATGPFHGYYPGWEGPTIGTPNQVSWLVLKAHTLNRAGTVKLRTDNPRDTPSVNFHYFEEGTDRAGRDLAAVVDGIKLARGINADLQAFISKEVVPGSTVMDTEDITNFVKNEAWGHHASCSNKMGPRSDHMSVVDANFRVHGTRGLRVVDASIFPRIPGYYVMLPIFMISEKASDVILAGN